MGWNKAITTPFLFRPTLALEQSAPINQAIYLGKCACYISLPLSLVHYVYSLFRHFGAWDCCNSDGDNEFRLHMNGCSDPSSSTVNNLREWGSLRNEYAENIRKKSVYYNKSYGVQFGRTSYSHVIFNCAS